MQIVGNYALCVSGGRAPKGRSPVERLNPWLTISLHACVVRSWGWGKYFMRILSAGIGAFSWIVLAFSLVGCGTSVVNVAPERSAWNASEAFSRAYWRSFAAPKPNELADSISLFGTYYYTPTHGYLAGGVPILDLAGRRLGPRLSVADFCNAADEGAFRAQPSVGKSYRSYTIDGALPASDAQTDCSGVFKSKLSLYTQGEASEHWPVIVAAFERSRYRQTTAPYGNGKGEHWLVPWRTVATYNPQITQGTVLYIPHLRGAKVKLPTGQTVRHDGYFFAADSGGGIKSGHIDFFTGLITPRPSLLPGVDGSDQQFAAYVIQNPELTAHFKGLHRMD